MRDPYASVAEQLTAGGFREVEPACFTSDVSPRVVGLAVCQPDPETWRQKTEQLLRKETLRLALSWARYVIIVVESPKTPQVAWAAAAFAQDVSKCRRIVLLLDRAADANVALPFIGLPSLNYAVDAPPLDVETIVRKVLPSGLADAFLDEDVPAVRVQNLAEESDS